MYLALQFLSMRFTSFSTSFLLFLIIIVSCKKDAGPEPARDMQLQTVDDDLALKNYLQSHFYNYEDFEAEPDNHKIQIDIDTIADQNSDKTPLWDQVQEKSILITDRQNNEFTAKLYFVIAKTGVGEHPSNVDSTFVTYQGKLLTNQVFDQSDTPMWFDLATGVIRGFKEFLPELKAGDHSVNNDGTYDLDHYGQGVFFIPSSLGYFDRNLLSIPKYSPLIFSVALHKVNAADHDNDGVLSRDEDPDGDGDPLNDDTDQDRNVNFLDTDDDNDGTPTREEYDRDKDGIADDDDNDGTPDYLDSDSS